VLKNAQFPVLQKCSISCASKMLNFLRFKNAQFPVLKNAQFPVLKNAQFPVLQKCSISCASTYLAGLAAFT